jgi:hypothetical protein
MPTPNEDDRIANSPDVELNAGVDPSLPTSNVVDPNYRPPEGWAADQPGQTPNEVASLRAKVEQMEGNNRAVAQTPNVVDLILARLKAGLLINLDKHCIERTRQILEEETGVIATPLVVKPQVAVRPDVSPAERANIHVHNTAFNEVIAKRKAEHADALRKTAAGEGMSHETPPPAVITTEEPVTVSPTIPATFTTDPPTPINEEVFSNSPAAVVEERAIQEGNNENQAAQNQTQESSAAQQRRSSRRTGTP